MTELKLCASFPHVSFFPPTCIIAIFVRLIATSESDCVTDELITL